MTAPPVARHLADLVRELAAAAPDRPVLVDVHGSLSRGGLEALVEAWARGLRALGVGRGSVVGLLCTNRREWLGCALGAQRLGARVAACNTWVRAWDLGYLLAHSGAEVLVTQRGFRGTDFAALVDEVRPDAPALREVVVLDDDGPPPAGMRTAAEVLAAGGPAPLDPAARAPEDDAFVLYTSGSSARPKAVPMVHEQLVANGWAIGERMALGQDDRVLVAVPLFWAYGAVNALPATLTHGGCLVLQEAFAADAALDLVEHERCTAIYTLPSITASLLAAPGFAAERVASLRTGLTIGTPAEVRRGVEELGVEQLCNVYGATETYGNCCVTPRSWPAERRITTQGPPLPGMELRTVDPVTRTALVAGELGEIEVRGRVVRGYLDAPEGAADAFSADGWYRTGDLGTLDADGVLTFSARAAEMIKVAGINVAPREVEELLGLHPDVGDVAVAGVPDDVRGEEVVAFVVAGSSGAPDPAALIAFCRDKAASYKAPARIHIVEALPRTDTGKLARRQLAALDQQLSAQGSPA